MLTCLGAITIISPRAMDSTAAGDPESSASGLEAKQGGDAPVEAVIGFLPSCRQPEFAQSYLRSCHFAVAPICDNARTWQDQRLARSEYGRVNARQRQCLAASIDNGKE